MKDDIFEGIFFYTYDIPEINKIVSLHEGGYTTIRNDH